MPQPYSIVFGPWVPDGTTLAIAMPNQYAPSELPLADCLNLYWADQGYRSLSSFSAISGAVAGALSVSGAYTALDSSGSPQIYAGTLSDLYWWNGSSWVNVSVSPGAYSGSHWSFATLGGCVLGVNGNNFLQDMTVGGANFAAITGAPAANVIGIVGQFAMLGDIVGSPNYPYRVQWPAIADPTTWPTPLTNAALAVQSGYEDLTQDFGRVMFIAGYPQMGVIFQESGITRATYQGGDVVFAFAPYEFKRGLVARGAAVQVGALTHFLSGDGFHLTDGSQVIPTGAATDGSIGLNHWFWRNVNTAALSAITAAWDSALKCVVFAIPTGSNTSPDTLLLLNPADSRWTRAALPTGRIWTDTDGTRHRVGVFSQTNAYGLLTGAAPSGYAETYDGSFLDGRVRDVVAAQLNGPVTDSPTMRIGYRESISDAITYSSDASLDSFTRRATWDPAPAGRLIRVRATSTAASALNGVTLFTEMGGV